MLALLTGWLAEPVGTLLAGRTRSTPSPRSAPVLPAGSSCPGGLKLRLAELVTAQEDGLLPLVTAALEDPASHGAMAEALTAVALSPDSRQRAAVADLLATLSDVSMGGAQESSPSSSPAIAPVPPPRLLKGHVHERAAGRAVHLLAHGGAAGVPQATDRTHRSGLLSFSTLTTLTGWSTPTGGPPGPIRGRLSSTPGRPLWADARWVSLR